MDRKKYKFSLILCTINRYEDVIAFLESLLVQEYTNFECIIVDQNKHDKIKKVYEKYRNYLNLVYHKSTIKGLSVNRNIGISLSNGEIIAFPDDDCEYRPKTLMDVLSRFVENAELDILTINIRDKITEQYFRKVIKLRLTDRNYYPYAISIGIFVKARDTRDLSFDEKMGAGTYWGAGEESDFISNLLSKSYMAIYDGELFVNHPYDVISQRTVQEQKKRYMTYSAGYGALIKKEIVLRGKYYLIYIFLFDLLKRVLASCLPLKKRILYWYSVKYRLLGFLSYKIDN